jgi:Zn-dependent protease with chaperone function
MDVRPPHAIDVSAEVNAWIGRYGWRQTRRLTIGLPLFALLDPQERVALLAHELAHERHGDLARMPLVQGAMSTLSEVYWLLVPYPSVWVTRSGRRYRRSLGIDALINPVMAFLALLMRPTVRLYVLLMARQTQRGEYLADAAAAEVAGSAAARSSFMKLHAAAAFSGQVLTTSFSEEDQIFDRLRRRVQSAPGHEWLRVERVMALEKSRLDVTHPPSARRVEVIGRMPMREPAVIATAEQMAQIDRELSAAESAVAREMADRHRGRLYS